MAPQLRLLLFTCVCFLIANLPVVVSRNSPCASKDCQINSCPKSCSCLGVLVDCSGRGLVEIPKDMPVWVEMLDLQNNGISSIDDEAFNGLQNLAELDLSNNQLRSLNSSSLFKLTSLKKLFVNKNRLSEFPQLIPPSLATFSLQHNEIHNLNGSHLLEDLPNLQDLDLSFNDVAELPASAFGHSSALLHLSLSHNKILTMEKGVFDNLTSLESLKLNKNKLSSIPKELFQQLASLRHLEMNSNSFTEIEGLSFQGLTSLLVLKIRHSGIIHLLDGAFYGLTAIKKLQLDYNNIGQIRRGWLYGLNSLQRIYLNNNNISAIEDDAWDSGKRLLEIDLMHNKLQYITVKMFNKLNSLKRLILSNNLITHIEEGAFHSLSALQYLEMENNEVFWTVEDTSGVFAGLLRLKFLGLANNKIRSIVKKAFSGLSRLETLNLTLNELTTIEKNAFHDLPHLQKLLINTSSLICDCHLSWMTKNFHFPIFAKCVFPANLEDMSVFDVPDSYFACGSPKPSMIKEPHTKITLKGENVTLECQAKSSGIVDTKFLWRKDGKLLQGMWLWHKTENIQMGNYTLHKSWLSIQNIQDQDEGHYQCVIMNRFGSVYSNKTHITVHIFPVFTKTPVDVSIKTGSTARLECGAKGQPQPGITWRKDGGEDFPAARERRMHVMFPSDDVFFIVAVKPSDTGVYSCTAENVAGIISANVTLTVLETPSFSKKMEDKETKAGETAVLECMASGSPKPQLSWFKDGTPLAITERHFFTGGNQLLIIVQTKASDSGIYTCEMTNTVGTEQGTSHLNVLPATQGSGNAIDDNNMTGIIVIAVVVCVVGTSVVWVIVIHHTRKTRDDFGTAHANSSTQQSDITPFNSYKNMCPKDLQHSITNIYLDSHSGHSKDSGTGDSAQPSSDDLLIEEDDQGLLLEMHSKAALSGAHQIGSLLAIQESGRHNSGSEPYASSNSSVSKEHVPLLPSIKSSHVPWKSHRKSIAEFRHQRPSNMDGYVLPCRDRRWPCVLVQRSLSADQVNFSDEVSSYRGCSEPPQNINVTRVDSEGIERDSGFSTFPRSITQASVSNLSSESPRLHRLPKDTPNDSGSFSIASEDVHIHPNPINMVSDIVPMIQSPTSRTLNSTGVKGLEQKT